jgi:hypothetical protein
MKVALTGRRRDIVELHADRSDRAAWRRAATHHNGLNPYIAAPALE